MNQLLHKITVLSFTLIFLHIFIQTQQLALAQDVKQARIEKQEIIDPDDFKDAVELFNQGKYNDALVLFDAMGHKGKYHDQVHYYIGLCCQKTNQLARAKNEFIWVYQNTKDPYLKYNSQVAWNNSNQYQHNRTYKGQGNTFARYSSSRRGGT